MLQLRKAWDSLAWYVKGLLGEDAYEKYLVHQAAVHPTGEVMSEREFWRDKTDRQDANPQGRCC